MYYIHKDHLGSVNVISNENGDVVEEHSFDAWGRRRNAENWTYSDIEDEHITDRGYTGHEHLDQFGIINMNGRVYDPIIGRFLNPDKFVQAPQSTQSFNRYSYCMNNPLNTTDPSGWVGGNTSGGGGEGNGSSGLYGADGMTNSQWMYNSSPNRSNPHYRDIYNMQNPSAAKQNNVSIRVYTHTTTSTKTGNDGLLVTVGTKHYKVIDFAQSSGVGMDEASLTLTYMGAAAGMSSDHFLGAYNSEYLFRRSNIKPIGNSYFVTGKYVWSNPNKLKLGGAFRLTGNVLGAVGVFYSGYQIFTNQVSLGDGLTNIGFGLIGFAGLPGAIISGLYFTDEYIQEKCPAYKDFVEQREYLNDEAKSMNLNPSYWHACFTAGTSVLLKDNKFENIESVQIGDSVITYNISKEQLEFCKVTETFRYNVNEIYKLTISGSDLLVTKEHPFYVINKGWVKVSELQIGDHLFSSKNKELQVTHKSIHSKNIDVFNIHVEGNHNYFVSPLKILVHNK